MAGFEVDRRTATGAVAASLLLALAACGHSEQPGSEGSSQPSMALPTSFVPFLRARGVTVDYAVHPSPAVLSSAAALVIVGTVRSVGDGRVFGAGPTADGGPGALNLTYVVHVDRVLAGDASLVRGGLVYVELPRAPSVPVAAARRALPSDQRVVLFLSDYSEGDDSGAIASSPVVPEGAPTLAPYTEGFLVEDQATRKLVGGLESLDQLPAAWREHTDSIEQFVAANFPAT